MKIATLLLEGESVVAPFVAKRLSRRQAQVLECFINGRSYKEIASQYGLSVHTVHVHLQRAYQKLKVHSRYQAINVATGT